MASQDKQTHKYEVSSAEIDNPSSTIFSKLKDPAFRKKLLNWIWLPCAIFTLGIVVSQGGPTVLDLRIITDTDEETGSFFFTSLYGGYLLGSFVAGGVHGKISNNLVMVVVTLLSGASTIATPYCTNLTLMLCVRGIVGFFLGGIDCSINAEHMRIWGNEGQVLMNVVHFSFAIGGVIGPAVSAPFLAEEENTTETTTTTPYPNVTQSTVIDHTEAKNSTLPRTSDIHYAYLIAGITVALASIPFIVMLIFDKKSKADEEKHVEIPQRKLPISLHLFLTAVLCAYYVIYCCIENAFGSFLETFLVDEFKTKISKKQAAYITTYYWAAFAAGRFTAIFTSTFLMAIQILYIQFSLLIIAISGILVSTLYARIDALKAFTCLVGLACSAIYPSGFLWTETEIMKVTGIVSGVILVGSSLGCMISPFILGHLMQHVSSLCYCYFLIGSFAVDCSLFLFLLFFNRFYVNRKYGNLKQTTGQEKQINLSTKHSESAF